MNPFILYVGISFCVFCFLVVLAALADVALMSCGIPQPHKMNHLQLAEVYLETGAVSGLSLVRNSYYWLSV